MNNCIIIEVIFNSLFVLVKFIMFIILCDEKPPTKGDVIDLAILLAQYASSNLILLYSIHS